MTLTPDEQHQARRNRIMGGILGTLCLAQVIVFIILFSKYGFPKDPTVWRAQQDAASQHHQVTP
jgi:hypothetical protein